MASTHNSFEVLREPPDKDNLSVNIKALLEFEREKTNLESASEPATSMESSTTKIARPRSDNDSETSDSEGFQVYKAKKSRIKSSETVSTVSRNYSLTTPENSSSNESEFKIIIISSINNEAIFRNPIKTEKVISQSIFSPYLINDKIQVLGRGSTIKLFLNTNSPHFPLREISKLSDDFPHPVKCYTPTSVNSNISYGIVAPICPEVSLEELKLSMRVSEGPNSRILKVSPVFVVRDGQRVRSDRVRVDFVGDLPARVFCGSSSYKVSLYFPEPLRCFCCQKYGHGSYSCRYREKCRMCGDAYNQTNHIRSDKCTRSHYCLHCRSPGHCSGSMRCPIFIKAREIMREAVINKVSNIETRKKLADLNDQPVQGRYQISNSQSRAYPQNHPSLHQSSSIHNHNQQNINAYSNNNNNNNSLNSRDTYAKIASMSTSKEQFGNDSLFQATQIQTEVDVHVGAKESYEHNPKNSEGNKRKNNKNTFSYPDIEERNIPRPIPPLIPNVPNYSNVNNNSSNLSAKDLGNFLFQLLILLHRETSKEFIPIFVSLCNSCFGVSTISQFF